MAKVKTYTILDAGTVLVEKVSKKADTEGNVTVVNQTVCAPGTVLKIADSDRYTYNFYILNKMDLSNPAMVSYISVK